MSDSRKPVAEPAIPALPVILIGAAICLIVFKSIDLGIAGPPVRPAGPAQSMDRARDLTPGTASATLADNEPSTATAPATTPPVEGVPKAPRGSPGANDSGPPKPGETSVRPAPAGNWWIFGGGPRPESKNPGQPPQPITPAGKSDGKKEPALVTVPSRCWVPVPGESLQVWTDRGSYENFRFESVSPTELVGKCDAGVEKLLRLPISRVWGVASHGRLFVPRGDSFVDTVTVYRFDRERRKFEQEDRAPEAGRPADFENRFSRLPGRCVYDPKSKDLWIIVSLRDIPRQIDPEDVGTIRTAHLTFTYDHVAGQYVAESEQQRADRRHKVQKELQSRKFFEQQYRLGRDVPFGLFPPPGIEPPPAPPAKKS